MKIKLTPGILKLAYKFIDIESLGESSVLDGRTTEYGFALGRLARLPVGKLLDVGCVARVNPVVSTMCELGWKVYGIDIRDYKYSHPNFVEFIRADITQKTLQHDFFDAITAISTLEHIGVKGRYGIEEDDYSGFQKATDQVRKCLKLGGTFIITLPLDKNQKSSSLGRTYPPTIVAQMFRDWSIRSFRLQSDLMLLDLVKEKE